MSRLYHITPGAEWAAAQASGEYRLSTRGKTLALSLDRAREDVP